MTINDENMQRLMRLHSEFKRIRFSEVHKNFSNSEFFTLCRICGVATDFDSLEKLSSIAQRNGFEIFAGPLEDVLERFCLLIKETDADTVIRATADNPFLFYESAVSLLEQFERRSQTGKCDYITYTGLPHGSGVEIFNAKSLLKAKEQTSDSYDHEHVGPALYNHQENFTSVFLNAPKEWNFPY